MNICKLKGKIVEKGLNVETLANMIGVDRATMYRKFNNPDKITIGEARRIKEALKLDSQEASDIFLP